MTEPQRYTAAEMLAVLSARQLKDGQVVFAGIGIPLLAATLAQRTALPGPDDPVRGRRRSAPSSSRASCRRRPTTSAAPSAPTWCWAAPRCCCCCSAAMSTSASWAARRSTSTAISTRPSSAIPTHPKTRLPGTGGGNDISSLTNMIVAMKHEKRRFVEKVDFITSPGFIRGGNSRAESGLPAGGMFRVITELAVFSFDDKTPAHEGAGAQSRASPANRSRTIPASS